MNAILRDTTNVARVALLASIWIVLVSSNAAAQEAKIYDGITQQMFDDCIKPEKKNMTAMGWAKYSEGNKGEVELKSYVLFYGTPARLTFDFDPNAKTVEYKLVPGSLTVGVTHSRIWTGFSGTMAQCKN